MQERKLTLSEIFDSNNKFTPEFFDSMESVFAENTILGYQNSMRQLLNYCDLENKSKTFPFSIEAIEDFISDKARYYKKSFMAHFLSTIQAIHKQSNVDEVEMEIIHLKAKKAFKEAYRKKRQSVKKAKALILDKIADRFDTYLWQGTQAEVRDKAMILLGFYGGMRRNEILEAKYEDLDYVPEKGYSLRIPFSKTNQMGDREEIKAIPINRKRTGICPVRAINNLLEIRGKKKGYLFTRIMKGDKWTSKQLEGKGFDYIFKKYFPEYSSHSLRAGFVTTAFQSGAEVNSIMNQTGHQDPKTPFAYNRAENIWIDNAVNQII